MGSGEGAVAAPVEHEVQSTQKTDQIPPNQDVPDHFIYLSLWPIYLSMCSFSHIYSREFDFQNTVSPRVIIRCFRNPKCWDPATILRGVVIL